MQINKNFGEGIVSYSINDLTPLEMHELCIMRKRIYQVIESHQKNSKVHEKDYVRIYLNNVLKPVATFIGRRVNTAFRAAKSMVG